MGPRSDGDDGGEFEFPQPWATRKLTDDDVGAALVCMDAAKNLTRLKLTGSCARITGVGLEPLRGSLVLRQLDVSMVGEPEPMISEGVVLPILLSIIETGGSSMEQLHLPRKWRVKRIGTDGWPKRSAAMKRFLRRYNEYLMSRPCRRCQHPICRPPQLIDDWGLQHGICYDCLDSDCRERLIDPKIELCSRCEKYYCNNCNPVGECGACGKDLCHECAEFEPFSDLCEECGEREGCDEHSGCCSQCILACDRCGERVCSNDGCEGYDCCKRCQGSNYCLLGAW